jgi:probable rRNA maturation factor
MILFTNDDSVSFNLKNKRLIKSWIKDIIQLNKKEVGDINYIFCSDEKILEINKEFLKHDYYTDIISFDYCEENKINGDIFISIDTVKSNSIKYKTEFVEELHRVIIHGVLHFLGFKDKTKADAEKMREAENKALIRLNKILSS